LVVVFVQPFADRGVRSCRHGVESVFVEDGLYAFKRVM